jgi:uncharacterized membrane protein
MGTAGGVLFCCIFYVVISTIMHVSGFDVAEMDSLIVIAYNTNIQIGDFMFVGVLFSSLGAVMDVSVSVASSVSEISETSPESDFDGLFRSGLRIGRDIIGATSNTLIMAFIGSSMVALIVFRIYNYQYNLLISHNDIALDILQAVASASALILCAPLTAFVAAHTYKQRHKSL